MPRPLSAALIGLLVLAGGAGGVVGCSGSPQPVASPFVGPVSAPAPTGSDGSPAVDDPPGTLACDALQEAVNGATLMEPGVVDAIVFASVTADAPVSDAAQRLAAAYATAITAHGSDSEPDAVAAVSAAGADMTRVCDESGLATVG
jgi:hypothetical protein